MTLFPECEAKFEKFKKCVDKSSIVGRLTGDCADLEAIYNECMDVETRKRMEQSYERGKAHQARWEKHKKDHGIQ